VVSEEIGYAVRSPKFIWQVTLVATGVVLCLFMLAHHIPARLILADVGLPAFLLIAGPRVINAYGEHRLRDQPLAPLIAIVGCDGAGKSTLAADAQAVLNARRPTEICYLGLGSGELGNRIKRLPLIGLAVERKLAKKAQQTRTKDERIPGLATALVVFGFSLMRRRRFRHMLALRRKGVIVITDRYPQIEVPGFYDGPGLSAARAGGPIVAWLAARERQMYVWMASYRPDIVIRLNIDVATAFARKPDHKFALLEEKVRVTPLLRFNGARIVDLDSREPYADVKRETLANIAPLLVPARPVDQRHFHMA
jgi:thymidylate kinase